MIRNLRELYQYRALLWNLTQRELKARYRGSFLGFFWTFLNPILQMAVYGVFFSILTQQSIKAYPYFMFVGLLPWIWFSTAVMGGSSAISDRRDLLTKVRFPAQVLPATVLVSNLINYLLAIPLMVGLGLVMGIMPTWHAVFFPLIVAVQALFTLALSYVFSALNVTFRDLQHILANIVQLWFFLTPIAYRADQIPKDYRTLVVDGNPLGILFTSYQAIFYDHQVPELLPLAVLAVGSLALLFLTSMLFESRREEFAEAV